MLTIVVADKHQHIEPIRTLLWEYLQWLSDMTEQEFRITLDIATDLEDDLAGLDKFMPPQGRLLLAYVNEDLVGIVGLKALTPHIGEIKRMYVRPTGRKQGVGRALINQLVELAGHIGYERIQLNSVGFMTEAHQMYRTIGFRQIDAYEGSEISEEFHKYLLFMEMTLPPKRVS